MAYLNGLREYLESLDCHLRDPDLMGIRIGLAPAWVSPFTGNKPETRGIPMQTAIPVSRTQAR